MVRPAASDVMKVRRFEPLWRAFVSPARAKPARSDPVSAACLACSA